VVEQRDGIAGLGQNFGGAQSGRSAADNGYGMGHDNNQSVKR